MSCVSPGASSNTTGRTRATRSVLTRSSSAWGSPRFAPSSSTTAKGSWRCSTGPSKLRRMRRATRGSSATLRPLPISSKRRCRWQGSPMRHPIRLAPLAAVPSGEGRTFDLGSLQVAVFHARDGRVFATQARCPHRQGPLADGLLGGTTLVCPLHEWSFDLVSGMALHGSCGIQIYTVEVSADGTLVLTLESDAAPPLWRVSDYA